MKLAGLFAAACLLFAVTTASIIRAQNDVSDPPSRPRARDLGVPFDGVPGQFNAITDVAGVEVGFKTLISGEGKLVIGKGPVRTGVTAILPRGKHNGKSVFAGYFAGNGNGDMTGTHWIDESGLLETPILITNTGSVGVVRDAAVAWIVQQKRPGDFWYPVTAETADVPLNDIKGQHVTAQDTWDALNSASSGALQEGNVGGGTGMVCNGFKGGTGTSSRKVEASAGPYTVGVLVQCNYGDSNGLRVAGIPVAREMKLTETLRREATGTPGFGLVWRPRPGMCPESRRHGRWYACARGGIDHRDCRHGCAAHARPTETTCAARFRRIGPRRRD
jgi:D-aminopeptidase